MRDQPPRPRIAVARVNWRRRFDQPIPLRGGKRIVTLSDARAQLLAIDNPNYPVQVVYQAEGKGSVKNEKPGRDERAGFFFARNPKRKKARRIAAAGPGWYATREEISRAS